MWRLVTPCAQRSRRPEIQTGTAAVLRHPPPAAPHPARNLARRRESQTTHPQTRERLGDDKTAGAGGVRRGEAESEGVVRMRGLEGVMRMRGRKGRRIGPLRRRGRYFSTRSGAVRRTTTWRGRTPPTPPTEEHKLPPADGAADNYCGGPRPHAGRPSVHRPGRPSSPCRAGTREQSVPLVVPDRVPCRTPSQRTSRCRRDSSPWGPGLRTRGDTGRRRQCTCTRRIRAVAGRGPSSCGSEVLMGGGARGLLCEAHEVVAIERTRRRHDGGGHQRRQGGQQTGTTSSCIYIAVPIPLCHDPAMISERWREAAAAATTCHVGRRDMGSRSQH